MIHLNQQSEDLVHYTMIEPATWEFVIIITRKIHLVVFFIDFVNDLGCFLSMPSILLCNIQVKKRTINNLVCHMSHVFT